MHREALEAIATLLEQEGARMDLHLTVALAKEVQLAELLAAAVAARA